METGKRRSQRDYMLTFKLSVVDQVEKGELNYKEALERYGIKGKTTVLTWLRIRTRGPIWKSPLPSAFVAVPDQPEHESPGQLLRQLADGACISELKNRVDTFSGLYVGSAGATGHQPIMLPLPFFFRVVAALVKRSMTVPRQLDWAMNAFRCSTVCDLFAELQRPGVKTS